MNLESDFVMEIGTERRWNNGDTRVNSIKRCHFKFHSSSRAIEAVHVIGR